MQQRILERHAREARWAHHRPKLYRLQPSRCIHLVFAGSCLTEVFWWLRNKGGKVKRDGRMWIETADEPARVMKVGGRRPGTRMRPLPNMRLL